MSWLKRIQPVTLYQSSNTPYVILEDGVVLCFSNSYADYPEKEKYNLSFKVNRHDIKRTSTHYFEMKDFPKTIPFENVLFYNDTIIEGKVIKQAAIRPEPSKDVVVVLSRFIAKLNDRNFQEMVGTISNADHSFLIVGKKLDPQSRLIGDIASCTIYHNEDWGRTCVEIANHICNLENRKYCWTKSIPDLNIFCYGLRGADDMSAIQDTFNLMGLGDFSVVWETPDD